MTPVNFAGCFGWLHEAAGDVGVLLCTGLGGEALGAHFPLRVLADRLAGAGYPTLRFDYANTGDSCDAPVDGPLAAWRDSVTAAADCLRRSGVRRIVLCGLRFGATMAALEAATRDDVAALILLAPLVSGFSYSRVLKARAQFGRWTPPQEPGWLESDGLRLPAATLDALADINLGRTDRLAAPRVLLMDPAGGSVVTGYAARLRDAGAEVTQTGFEGDKLLCHSFRSAVPEADYATLLTWLRANVPLSAQPRPARERREYQPLHGPGWVEEPVRLGAAGHLFGMLCRPAGPAGELAVVIGNASADPHYGNCRFHVELARHLAGQGIASLRLDFAGLGDSRTGVVGEEETQTDGYEVSRTADLTLALDLLQRRGYRHLVLGGLCSGAYHALHGALADARVAGLLLLNLTRFTWSAGQSIGDMMAESRPPTRFYLQMVRSGVAWRRLLQGQVNIPSVTRTLGRRALNRAALGAARLAEFAGVPTASGLPRRLMRDLSRRGVQVLALSGLLDSGLEVIEENFGPRGVRLAALPGVTVRVVPEIDHGLTRSAMRATVAATVADFLRTDFRVSHSLVDATYAV